MHWVFVAGMFLGVNIGFVVACMIVSGKNRDFMKCEHHQWAKCNFINEPHWLSGSR